MTRTFDDPTGPARPQNASSRPAPAERALVLGGFALAVPATAWSAAAGAGLEAVAAAWLAAAVWAAISSLALALRRVFREGDWSAFRRRGMPFDMEILDWSTKSGQWLDMAVAEENERLMRDD